jgi:hypothetical protein
VAQDRKKAKEQARGGGGGECELRLWPHFEYVLPYCCAADHHQGRYQFVSMITGRYLKSIAEYN